MRLNVLKLSHLVTPRTHEGAPAAVITAEQALRRSVLSCMLWEGEFYEDGVQIANRIREARSARRGRARSRRSPWRRASG